jgi:hypothetical protein
MIVRPSTEQLLEDCARELLEEVLPVVAGEPAQVRVHMLAAVLRNAAVRSAHEIAWMTEESAAAAAYGRSVLDATGDPTLAGSLQALTAGQDPSLHLDDVAARYALAGDALGHALVAARRAGEASLLERGEQLLDERLAHERLVMAGYGIVGR